MRKWLKAFYLLLFLSVVPGFSVAIKPEVPLLESIMTVKQLKAKFSGQTVVARSVDGKRQKMVIYFATNGKVELAEKGRLKYGKWKIRKDDRLCINLKDAKRDCRVIVKKGSEYRQYVVKLDGNHKHELTYVSFQKGKALERLSESPLLPPGTLDKREVVALFSGKTVESVTAKKGRVSHSYYDKDGRVEQLRGGDRRFGTWRVTQRGRICLQMEDMAVKCRIIVKEGDKYKKYIVRKNGRHQHSVSYRNFKDGKHL